MLAGAQAPGSATHATQVKGSWFLVLQVGVGVELQSPSQKKLLLRSHGGGQGPERVVASVKRTYKM